MRFITPYSFHFKKAIFYGGHANLEETDKTDKLGTRCFFVPELMKNKIAN